MNFQSKDVKRILHRRVFRIAILCAVFILLVAVLIAMICVQMFKTQMSASNRRNCNVMIADITQHCEQENAGKLDPDYTQFVMDQSATAAGQHTFLFDISGNCILYSCGKELDLAQISMTKDMLYTIERQGHYVSDQTHGFDYTAHKMMMTMGLPITLTNESNVTETYYLFVNSSLDTLNASIRKICINAGMIWLVASVLFTVVLYYYMRLSLQPSFEIRKAVAQYAKGDFSERLHPEKIFNEEDSQLAYSINMIADNVACAEEQRRQFVSNVSHELRTPMTIISGYIDGILDGTIPKGKRTQYLHIVSQEMQRLKMLISSMLNLSKFDNGTISINYQFFSLNDMAFRTILMFESRLEKKNITVVGLDCAPVRAYGDPDLIGQVIYNLVENAVKFVNQNGAITFTFSEDASNTIFAVRNTGVGVSKQDLPKIFDRFYKTDASRSADKTGLGLGLDITRHIVRLHHGQISVTSDENQFTEFSIQMPKQNTVARQNTAE